MPNLEEVYSRLQLKKKERRDLQGAYQDELKNHARYQEILGQMKALREEKKSIESQLLNDAGTGQDLDVIKLDIKTDTEMLSDLALMKYIEDQSCEIIDEWNNRLVPLFSVRFTKDGYVEKEKEKK